MAARGREADELNQDLVDRLAELDGLLQATLDVDDYIDPRSLKKPWTDPHFDPGDLATPIAPPMWEAPEGLGGVKALLPGAKPGSTDVVAGCRRMGAEMWLGVALGRSAVAIGGGRAR